MKLNTRNTKNTKTKPAAFDPVEAARREVSRLNAAELRLATLYRQKAGELASVRAARGDQVLDAVDPSRAARETGARVGALLEEMESLADASRQARKRRLAAIPAVFIAQADEAELAAAKLEAEAAELEAESGRLRKALEAHDGCAYIPASPVMPDRLIGGRVPGGGGPIVHIRVPRFELLRLDATNQRDQARQHRQKKPLDSGSVNADSLDALLAAVYFEPERVGPTAAQVVDWSAQAVEKERRRSRTENGVDLQPVSLHLEWHHGTIDPGPSFVVSSETSEAETPFDSGEGFEEQSA